MGKSKSKSMWEKKLHLEKKLKLLEGKLNWNEAKDEYNICEENINTIYDEIASGIKIRSRCNWCELGEKSNKFSLNLEKYRAGHNTTRKVIHDAQEITGHQKINNPVFSFYKKLLEERLQNYSNKLLQFLKYIPIPSLTEEQKKTWEGELIEKEIYQPLIVFKYRK